MPFTVQITFDEPEDLYQLIERLTMPDTRLGIVLAKLETLSLTVALQGTQAMASYADMIAAIERTTTLVDAVVLYQAENAIKLAELVALRDNGTEEQFDAALAAMAANNDRLAAAMVVNTPEGEQPLPTPDPLPPTSIDPATGLPVEVVPPGGTGEQPVV